MMKTTARKGQKIYVKTGQRLIDKLKGTHGQEDK